MIDVMMCHVKLGLNLPRQNTACVVVRMSRLKAGQRNQVVKFGLKVIFGEDARG